MKFPVLDQDTFSAVAAACVVARFQGTAIPEELQRRGLLWTPARERELRMDTLHRFQHQLDTVRPVELLRLARKVEGQSSPADMLESIKIYLDKYIDFWRTS